MLRMDQTTNIYTLINENFIKHYDSIAIIQRKRGSNNIIASRTYKQICSNSAELQEILINLNIPKHVCVGIYLKERHCICLPIIIHSLQAQNICFIFLDSRDENLDLNKSIVTDLKLYLIISCGHEAKQLIQFLSKNYSTHSLFTCNLNVFVCNQSILLDNYEDICYVVRTSGTTGEPKYVEVQNYCIKSNIISLNNELKLTKNDLIYFGTIPTFDPAMIELFLGLTTGACLVVYKGTSPITVDDLFPQNQPVNVTFLQMCPSVFSNWSHKEIAQVLESGLKILALGGESFPNSALKMYSKPEHLSIYNFYGITEVSCWASILNVQNFDNVHLGECLDDTIFEVRDERGGVIVNGEGELFIGSNKRVCLINDEQFSNLQLPIFRATGDIVKVENKIYKYVCRKNNIFKRFGHRLDIHKIENLIYESVNILNKCLWIEKMNKLVTFLVIKDNKEVHKIVDKVRVKLLKDLTAEYIPDIIEPLVNLPCTKNGKVDLIELDIIAQKTINIDINEAQSAFNIFHKLWCKYFGLSNAEADNKKELNFMEMGGTSIYGLQFVDEFKIITKVDYDSNFSNMLIQSSYQFICDYLHRHEVIENAISVKRRKLEKSHNFGIKWAYNMNACIDTTPTIIKFQDKTYVAIGNFSNKFVILNAESGEEISATYLPDVIENECCVAATNNTVFVGCFDGNMYCLNVDTCEIVWSFQTGDRIKTLGCLAQNTNALVFGSYNKYLYSVDLKNGSLQWKTYINEAIISTPIQYNGNIYISGIKGKCVCLSEATGNIIWSYATCNPSFGSPQIVLGKCVLYSDICGNFYCLNLENGKEYWTYICKEKTNMYGSFLAIDNLILFGMQNGKIYLYELSEKEFVQKYVLSVNSPISRKPAIFTNQADGDHAVFTSNNGLIILIKYSHSSLKVLNSFEIGSECFSSPVLNKSSVFIGCRDNFLYCINIKL